MDCPTAQGFIPFLLQALPAYVPTGHLLGSHKPTSQLSFAERYVTDQNWPVFFFFSFAAIELFLAKLKRCSVIVFGKALFFSFSAS